ncbi:MAG: class I SAM-dependent methyltransferase [Verrucomicrobia bacterium]|nr:class I SAM-dependent methyltransferase [Verrucomicrobiota bacterium]MBU1910309.1 class I SAM-dependent methyltransferase [Verrucomicrobiota bacterium]
MNLKYYLKTLLFPGINLHGRLRYRVLPRFFGSARPGEERWFLDAGCGNGMLTYQAWRKGHRAVGVSIKEGEIERARRFFNEARGIPESQLSFRVHNLYRLEDLGLSFDEIVCSEVLEHIVRDADVIRSFAAVLKPGGVLHLCCPNADHPDNCATTLDKNESGGHVRPGYTLDSYQALLKPAGLRIIESAGLGGPVREFFNKRILRAQDQRRVPAAACWFLAGWALAWLDTPHPRVPYSLYVRAKKTM